VDATEWDERYSKAELEWGAEPNRFLVQEIEGLQPGRALDVAAGEGRNAIWLAGLGWNVTAVDFSRVAIDKARGLAAKRSIEVRWITADVVDYIPPADSFDLVIVFYLHLAPPDMKEVLSKAAVALKRRGTLLVVGHDRANLTDGMGGPQDPTVLLDAEEVASELETLVIEKAVQILRPVEGAAGKAIDTLVRARRP